MIDLCVEEENINHGKVSLKVIGIGGGGGNAVESMINAKDMDAVTFLVANTDVQSLTLSQAPIKIQIGSKITKGLGAGSDPDIGRRAAEEDLDEIKKHIEDADILFLTGGLGGGTCSGALPVVAALARELNILTVAIVSKPFLFEGKRRQKIAHQAISILHECVDTLIVVPNQRLIEITDENVTMLDAFALANDVLKQSIKGISDIITQSGHINVDFADVRAIMKNMGMALMGTGVASGQDRAVKAAQQAISSPLLENVTIKGAKGVLINITGSPDLGLAEVNRAASTVYELVSEDANIILGSVVDASMQDTMAVTVIATGFETQESSNNAQTTVGQEDLSTSVLSSAMHSEKKEENDSGLLVNTKATCTTEKDEKDRLKNTPSCTESCDDSNQLSEGNKSAELQSKQSEKFLAEQLDTPTFLRKKEELKNLWGATNISKISDSLHEKRKSENKKQDDQKIII